MSRRTLGLTSLAAAALALMITGRADAGARIYPQVTINSSTHTASGAMSTARAGFGNQYISCEVLGSTFDVHCEATAANGAHADCDLAGQFADLRDAITVGTINPDSYIEFNWITVPGVPGNVCGFLQVINSSEYEPKPF